MAFILYSRSTTHANKGLTDFTVEEKNSVFDHFFLIFLPKKSEILTPKRHFMAPKNKFSNKPAISLLAVINQAGGSAKIGPDKAGVLRLWIEPEKLALRLKAQIIASKQDLIGLLLGGNCVFCGFKLRMQGKSRILEENGSEGLKTRKFVTEQYCENCGKRGHDHIQPDFPVFDKSGKEI